MTWEAKFDTLAGFCGHQNDHRCISDYKPTVGIGEEGYNKVMDVF